MSHVTSQVLSFSGHTSDLNNFPNVAYHAKTLTNTDGPSIELTVMDAMGKPSTKLVEYDERCKVKKLTFKMWEYANKIDTVILDKADCKKYEQQKVTSVKIGIDFPNEHITVDVIVCGKKLEKDPDIINGAAKAHTKDPNSIGKDCKISFFQMGVNTVNNAEATLLKPNGPSKESIFTSKSSLSTLHFLF